MKKIRLLLILIFLFIVGFIFGLSRYLIFLPKQHMPLDNTNSGDMKSELLDIWYYKNGWYLENVNCLYHSVEDKLASLVSQWLGIINDEAIVNERIALQSVIRSNSDIYLSFDHNFLHDLSAADNYRLICSLLKTLYLAGFKNERVYFLAHHKYFHNNLLDFTVSWPTSFYLNDQQIDV
jgi:hypothetical protein